VGLGGSIEYGVWWTGRGRCGGGCYIREFLWRKGRGGLRGGCGVGYFYVFAHISTFMYLHTSLLWGDSEGNFFRLVSILARVRHHTYNHDSGYFLYSSM